MTTCTESGVPFPRKGETLNTHDESHDLEDIRTFSHGGVIHKLLWLFVRIVARLNRDFNPLIPHRSEVHSVSTSQISEPEFEWKQALLILTSSIITIVLFVHLWRWFNKYFITGVNSDCKLDRILESLILKATSVKKSAIHLNRSFRSDNHVTSVDHGSWPKVSPTLSIVYRKRVPRATWRTLWDHALLSRVLHVLKVFPDLSLEGSGRLDEKNEHPDVPENDALNCLYQKLHRIQSLLSNLPQENLPKPLILKDRRLELNQRSPKRYTDDSDWWEEIENALNDALLAVKARKEISKATSSSGVLDKSPSTNAELDAQEQKGTATLEQKDHSTEGEIIQTFEEPPVLIEPGPGPPVSQNLKHPDQSVVSTEVNNCNRRTRIQNHVKKGQTIAEKSALFKSKQDCSTLNIQIEFDRKVFLGKLAK
ncbi:hypothetical protein CDAR_255211 [Caerostris darwini]|uniref:Uncharacterized protein n=1 Tax=Caerostris darwini TaxID=1538125 RepID=A0AAV4V167_9ARAC|nr:hypothetical protein CDAR_255211 [Caerostris darwini]